MNVLSSSCGCYRPPVSARRRRLSDQPAQTSHSPGNPNSLRNNSVDAALKNNLLLSSTAKSKPLNHTLELFYRLSDRDTVTWNTIISACLSRGSYQTALRLFLDMLLSCSHPPDSITMRSVLIACIESNDLYLGLQIHSYVTKLQGSFLCSTDLTIISTCLVNLYCHFGRVEIAHKLFGRIPDKDIIAFTSMLVGYTQAGEFRHALSIFRAMMEESSSVSLNEYAFSCALHASTGIPSLSGGRQIHAQVIKFSVRSDAFVGTALVDMYAKCNEMECAKAALLDVVEPGVVAWNALLAGHLDGEESLELFFEMRFSGVNPDNTTFACVLRACRDLSICLAQQIHGLVVKTDEVDVDVFVGGALFAIYIDRGLVCESQRIFHEIVCKDIVAFNLAIQGCIQNRYASEAVKFVYEALETLKEANEETISPLLMGIGGLDRLKQLHALSIKLGFGTDRGNSAISNSLVRMYSEYHCLDNALRIFERLHSPDLVTWTSLISGFSRAGESQGAINLYARMVSKGSTEPPNNYTFSSIISSCANLGAIKEGKQVQAQIIKSHPSIASDTFVVSGLLHMYAKCGYIDEARRIFSGMQDRDLASWNAMITSLAQHGFAEQAIETFTELLNQNDVEPNHITFVGVLSACSHKGMVEKGLEYFRSIKEPTIDHYTCLVNLLGRAGHLEEARHVVEEMPFEPNDHIWSSLLAACSIHGNIELGEYSARHSLELNPTDPGTYVSISNMYAAVGRWSSVKLVRKLMRDQALRKDPGLSWSSIDQKTCVFFANEMFHTM